MENSVLTGWDIYVGDVGTSGLSLGRSLILGLEVT